MKLAQVAVDKPWGRDMLPPAFPAYTSRIGEVWFEFPEQPHDLLIKHIFTSEKLSIQVHPNDRQAREHGYPRGKDECWFVTEAQDGATLGIGLSQTLKPSDLREAAMSGAIEDLMVWRPVKAGDFFYIPAGTIHAIGAGVSLVEVQQNVDVTYRLYDYGRPRELHLEDGITVANTQPYDEALHCNIPQTDYALLARGPYFDLAFSPGLPQDLAEWGPSFLIPLSGYLECANTRVSAGECAYSDDPALWHAEPGTTLLIARSPRVGTAFRPQGAF